VIHSVMNSEDWAIVQNEALLQSESGAQETWEDANADDLDVARDHSAPSSSRGGHENGMLPIHINGCVKEIS
jgi:hypothetical protein